MYIAMPIVGERPTHGMRLVLRRGFAPPVPPSVTATYLGTATTPDERWEVRADVDDALGVTVTTNAPSEIAEYARRVVRIAVRDAKKDGLPLPRMLQRWRA
jgi:hypothetical protein